MWIGGDRRSCRYPLHYFWKEAKKHLEPSNIRSWFRECTGRSGVCIQDSAVQAACEAIHLMTLKTLQSNSMRNAHYCSRERLSLQVNNVMGFTTGHPAKTMLRPWEVNYKLGSKVSYFYDGIPLQIKPWRNGCGIPSMSCLWECQSFIKVILEVCKKVIKYIYLASLLKLDSLSYQ